MRATSFQHRTPLVAKIGSNRTTLLTGLGGVGKTQLAAEYAESRWDADELDVLVWITADSREAVVSEYANLAVGLTAVDDPDVERGARRLLDWLAGTSARWLVVLDDIQNPADLRDLWPRTSATGQVVATTRRRDAALRGADRAELNVNVFSTVESESYLHATFATEPHLSAGATDLAMALRHLPLALAQAGAYILDRDISCTEYLARFNDRRRTLASLFPDVSELPDEHRATVATTWSLSVELADQLTPRGLARPLLAVASLLDANGVPVDLFETPPIVDFLRDVTGRETTADDSNDGLGCLHRLSLITLDRHSRARIARVHALVQRATRDDMPSVWLEKLDHCVPRALNTLWPNVDRDLVRRRMLWSNIEAFDAATDGRLWDCQCRGILFEAGSSRGQSGAVTATRDYYVRLRAVASERLGPDAWDTLYLRTCSAQWIGAAGNPQIAIAELEDVLADCRAFLGEEDNLTLGVRNNLAFWRANLGDPHAALAAFHELLPVQLRVLGSEHLDTLVTKSNIARFLAQSGRRDAAVAAFEELMPVLKGVLGPAHTLTLTSAHNLAYARGENGDPGTALEELYAVLADEQRVLGADHPTTLLVRNSISRFKGMLGNYRAAVEDLTALLADCDRVLGENHPTVYEILIDKAYWQTWAGELSEAAATHETAAAVLRRMAAVRLDGNAELSHRSG